MLLVERDNGRMWFAQGEPSAAFQKSEKRYGRRYVRPVLTHGDAMAQAEAILKMVPKRHNVGYKPLPDRDLFKRPNADALMRPIDQPCPRTLSGWHVLRERKLTCAEVGDGHEYRSKNSHRMVNGHRDWGCGGFHYGVICTCGQRPDDEATVYYKWGITRGGRSEDWPECRLEQHDHQG